MSAHRYWRQHIRAGNGSAFVGISEIELRESIAGADVSSTGTASASTSYPGLPASGAIDDSSGEWASDGSAYPQWWKWDSGAGNERDIVEISVKGRPLANQCPTDWEWQYSDNDIGWTPKFAVQDSSWFSGQVKVYNASSHPTNGAGNQEFWRVLVTAADGGAVISIGEIEMRVTPTGADECTGGTAFASTVVEEGPVPNAARAFDNDSGAAYWAAATAANEWCGYRLPAAKAITVLAITARTGAPSQSPKNFSLQRWDGSAFQTAFSLTNITGWIAGQKRWFDSTGEIAAPTAGQARPFVFICT